MRYISSAFCLSCRSGLPKNICHSHPEMTQISSVISARSPRVWVAMELFSLKEGFVVNNFRNQNILRDVGIQKPSLLDRVSFWKYQEHSLWRILLQNPLFLNTRFIEMSALSVQPRFWQKSNPTQYLFQRILSCGLSRGKVLINIKKYLNSRIYGSKL